MAGLAGPAATLAAAPAAPADAASAASAATATADPGPGGYGHGGLGLGPGGGLGGPGGHGLGGLPGGPGSALDASAQQQKQRFVWSPELHQRFEAAVAELGLDAAKPQAIAQLMDLHGENAPTRQNIKSHLQKYRLHMQKRRRRRRRRAREERAPRRAVAVLQEEKGQERRGRQRRPLPRPPLPTGRRRARAVGGSTADGEGTPAVAAPAADKATGEEGGSAITTTDGAGVVKKLSGRCGG